MYIELFISLAVISLISLGGVVTIGVNHKKLERFLELMVAFAVGALLGDVFIHLLPELGESGFSLEISLTIFAGMLVFFILEKYIHWHHCHHADHDHKEHSFGYVSLAGDALHNFIDGIIMAGAFMVSPSVGFSTAIAVFLHELPQEIGDFGIMLSAGFSKKKALIFNFLVSLTSFIGAILAIVISGIFSTTTPYLVAFTTGGFLYLAGTDLLPRLQKNMNLRETVIQIICLLIGAGIMLALLTLE